ALLNYRHSSPAPHGVDASSAWEGIKYLAGEERTNYPFTISIDDWGETFSITAQVQSPVDAGSVCELVARAAAELVSALESAQTRLVGSLDVVPTGERERLLEEWNATKSTYPKDKCIHELFEERAARCPEAIGVVDESLELSYGELNAQANRVA